jgi:hypothetical protein
VTGQIGPVLCLPCRWVLHDACMGAVIHCECFTELLMEIDEAEDRDEGRDQ